MESILYNEEKKEVVIILGYGLGNHLSFQYLQEVIYNIRQLFPKLPIKEAHSMKFLEVAQSSRRHKSMFYTRFPYDLSKNERSSSYITIEGGKMSAYVVTAHKAGENGWNGRDETAEQVMSRMIHD